MATVDVVAQHARVPLGRTEDGRFVYIEREWLNAITALGEAIDAAGTVTNDGDLTLGQVVVGAGDAEIKILPAGTNAFVLTMVAGIAAWAASAGGGGTPGGANKDIQYNNAGAFGGIAPSTVGFVLTDNGAGVTPSFQAASGGGGLTRGEVQALFQLPVAL